MPTLLISPLLQPVFHFLNLILPITASALETQPLLRCSLLVLGICFRLLLSVKSWGHLLPRTHLPILLLMILIRVGTVLLVISGRVLTEQTNLRLTRRYLVYLPG